MIVVGIDPGITTTGVVSIYADGRPASFRAIGLKWDDKQKRLEPARLRQMVKQVYEELRLIARHGELFVAIEEPFVGANGATALKQYAVFAALLDRLTESLRPGHVLVVAPTTLKKFVGAKKKENIAREVLKRWDFEHDDNNVVDAFAIAQWAASQKQ